MRRLAVVLLFLAVLTAPLAGEGQPGGKVYRVGYLTDRLGPGAFEETFLHALRELGYIEGRNLVIEYRWAEGRVERLPALAAELVSLNVDMIVTSGVPSAKAAKAATTSIPVVMATSADAVSDGLVASFARPGGNVTGMSLFSRELSGKRLEIVKETIPGITRVAVLFNSLNPSNPPQFKETAAAAERLGLQAVPLSIRFPDGVEPAFAEAARNGARAVLVVSDSATITHRTHLGAAGLKYRVPTMFTNKAYLEGGGMMSYGPDIFEVYRHAASYVDRILKGARPGDLPIEQPTKFELVINLKTAKALGLTVPQSVLLRADEVIQ